jgi:hypothetical protein
MVMTDPTTCQGEWRLVDVIHGTIEVHRCSGCAERMVITHGRRVDVPTDITGRKAIVRFIRGAK